MTLTPTTGKLITKREKACKVNLLTGKLAIEELFKRRQAELDKVRPDRERIVQQFGTILVSNTRLRTITRNLEKEYRIEVLQAKKAVLLHKKKEYQERVKKYCKEKKAKKAKKLAQKQARAAELVSLVSRPSRKKAST